MFSPLLTDLIGRRFSACIGEPWDFASEAGENCLKGKITDAWFDQDKHPLIRCEVSSFKRKGKMLSDIILVNRYGAKQDVVANLLAGESVGVNLVFRIDGGPIERSTAKEALSDSLQVSFLVGTVTLAEENSLT